MASSVIGNLRVALGLDSAAFQGGLRNASKQADGFAATIRGLAASMAGAFSVGALAAAADQFTQMQNALRALEGDQAAVNRTMEELNAIAGRTRAPLDATVKLYQRMAISANELGVNQRDVFRFTENIGLALAQAGGSSQEAAGALFQLSQAMGGGIVRAEEFNSIVEGAYPIALAAAKGINEAGGSVAKLRQIMLAGNLTSKQFFDAILSQTDELEETFGRTMPTISQALGRLRDSFVVFIGQMDQGAGASGRVAQAILLLAENLGRVATYAGTAAAGWVTYRVAIMAASAATTGFTGALMLLRGALLRTGIGALVIGAGELVYQFNEAIRVTGNLKAAFYAMAADFIGALRRMAGHFVEFTWTLADGFNNLFNTNLTGMGATITQELAQAEMGLRGMAGAASTATVATGEAASATERLNAALANVGDTAVSGGGRAASGLKPVKDAVEDINVAGDQMKDTFGRAFADLTARGGEFRDVLSSVLSSLAEMAASSAFNSIWGKVGGSSFLGGIGDLFGIGRNANGTNNWHGGWSWVNERGGELMNLPSGTQIIPHDISKRMVDQQAAGGGDININVTGATGNQEVQRMVAAGVTQGLTEYDRAMPQRLQQINQNPRFR